MKRSGVWKSSKTGLRPNSDNEIENGENAKQIKGKKSKNSGQRQVEQELRNCWGSGKKLQTEQQPWRNSEKMEGSRRAPTWDTNVTSLRKNEIDKTIKEVKKWFEIDGSENTAAQQWNERSKDSKELRQQMEQMCTTPEGNWSAAATDVFVCESDSQTKTSVKHAPTLNDSYSVNIES